MVKAAYRFVVGAVIGFLIGTILWTSGYDRGFTAGYGMAMSDAFLEIKSPEQFFKDLTGVK